MGVGQGRQGWCLCESHGPLREQSRLQGTEKGEQTSETAQCLQAECWLRNLRLFHHGPESAGEEFPAFPQQPWALSAPTVDLSMCSLFHRSASSSASPPTMPTSRKEHPNSLSVGLLGPLARPPNVLFLFPPGPH